MHRSDPEYQAMPRGVESSHAMLSADAGEFLRRLARQDDVGIPHVRALLPLFAHICPSRTMQAMQASSVGPFGLEIVTANRHCDAG